MFAHLQILDPRERLLVGTADVLLAGASAVARLWPRRREAAEPRRILLMRLERIGDLLMAGGAIEMARARAPGATIDLVVGSWNEEMARLLPRIDRVEVVDAPWLARGSGGASLRTLARARAVVARSRLRSRDQLRGGHPQPRADGALGRAGTGRLRHGRRRSASDPAGRVPSRRALVSQRGRARRGGTGRDVPGHRPAVHARTAAGGSRAGACAGRQS